MTQRTTPVRMLLVEDDVLQSELVVRALGRDGFEIRTATSIAELRSVAPAFAPELVLVDVNMPDAPVSRMVTIVREVAPNARVVLYSAWEESKLRGLARELGTDGFISKSESVFDMANRLRTFV